MGKEVRNELVTTVIALGEVVVSLGSLKLQVDPLSWNCRGAQLDFELVRRVA